MMNREMSERMKIAGEYQRKAVRALFPEQMGEHLDVIERELKMMVIEMAAELLKDRNESNVCRNEQSHEKTSGSGARKVDIT